MRRHDKNGDAWRMDTSPTHNNFLAWTRRTHQHHVGLSEECAEQAWYLHAGTRQILPNSRGPCIPRCEAFPWTRWRKWPGLFAQRTREACSTRPSFHVTEQQIPYRPAPTVTVCCRKGLGNMEKCTTESAYPWTRRHTWRHIVKMVCTTQLLQRCSRFFARTFGHTISWRVATM